MSHDKEPFIESGEVLKQYMNFMQQLRNKKIDVKTNNRNNKKLNPQCPKCGDWVCDLKEHLTWCDE